MICAKCLVLGRGQGVGGARGGAIGSKEYVEIPAAKLKGNALRLWVGRSLRYTRFCLPK